MAARKPLTFRDFPYTGESPPQPPAEQPLYIAVVDMPRGPFAILDEKDRPRVFFTQADARKALRKIPLVAAFGCELFQIGTGIKL